MAAAAIIRSPPTNLCLPLALRLAPQPRQVSQPGTIRSLIATSSQLVAIPSRPNPAAIMTQRPGRAATEPDPAATASLHATPYGPRVAEDGNNRALKRRKANHWLQSKPANLGDPYTRFCARFPKEATSTMKALTPEGGPHSRLQRQSLSTPDVHPLARWTVALSVLQRENKRAIFDAHLSTYLCRTQSPTAGSLRAFSTSSPPLGGLRAAQRGPSPRTRGTPPTPPSRALQAAYGRP